MINKGTAAQNRMQEMEAMVWNAVGGCSGASQCLAGAVAAWLARKAITTPEQ